LQAPLPLPGHMPLVLVAADLAVQFALAGDRLDPADAQQYTFTSGPVPRAGVSA